MTTKSNLTLDELMGPNPEPEAPLRSPKDRNLLQFSSFSGLEESKHNRGRFCRVKTKISGSNAPQNFTAIGSYELSQAGSADSQDEEGRLKTGSSRLKAAISRAEVARAGRHSPETESITQENVTGPREGPGAFAKKRRPWRRHNAESSISQVSTPTTPGADVLSFRRRLLGLSFSGKKTKDSEAVKTDASTPRGSKLSELPSEESTVDKYELSRESSLRWLRNSRSPRTSRSSRYSMMNGADGSAFGHAQSSGSSRHSMVNGADGSAFGHAQSSRSSRHSVVNGADGSAFGHAQSSRSSRHSMVNGADASAFGHAQSSQSSRHSTVNGADGSAFGHAQSSQSSRHSTVNGADGSAFGHAQSSRSSKHSRLNTNDERGENAVKVQSSASSNFSATEEGVRKHFKGKSSRFSKQSGCEEGPGLDTYLRLKSSLSSKPSSRYSSRQSSLNVAEDVPGNGGGRSRVDYKDESRGSEKTEAGAASAKAVGEVGGKKHKSRKKKGPIQVTAEEFAAVARAHGMSPMQLVYCHTPADDSERDIPRLKTKNGKLVTPRFSAGGTVIEEDDGPPSLKMLWRRMQPQSAKTSKPVSLGRSAFDLAVEKGWDGPGYYGAMRKSQSLNDLMATKRDKGRIEENEMAEETGRLVKGRLGGRRKLQRKLNVIVGRKMKKEEKSVEEDEADKIVGDGSVGR